jgi:hypothetical protein
MPTAVNGQLYYSQAEVQAGLPQYHAALRQATGYTGQFSADPTQGFQQYISGATLNNRLRLTLCLTSMVLVPSRPVQPRSYNLIRLNSHRIFLLFRPVSLT